MHHVLFNYVVDGVVVEGPMPYATVCERTGLKDTPGFAELGYHEHMPVPEFIPPTREQIAMGVRNFRNYLLQQSDWTQLGDAQLTTEAKALWATYRQQLRDMPVTSAQATMFDEVTWPIAP
jgi:Phage tail assembly chaperone protein